MTYSSSDIEAFVADIERTNSAIAQRASAMLREGIRQPIEAELGHLTINQFGNVLDIQFDRTRLRDSSETALATYLLRAIHNGQMTARTAVNQSQNNYEE